MKRFALILAALMFAMTSVGQDFNRIDAKGRRQGPWRDFYPNGQLRYEGQFKNDKCKGVFKYYDELGNLKATNEFDKSGEKALNKVFLEPEKGRRVEVFRRGFGAIALG